MVRKSVSKLKKVGPLRLPVIKEALGRPGEGTPTLEEAKARLGGPYPSTTDAKLELVGRCVWIPERRGELLTERRPGVIIVATGQDRDVWLGRGRVMRTTASKIKAPLEESDLSSWLPLIEVGQAAARFAYLSEGAHIAFRKGERVARGTLREKCRYGALVQEDPGTQLGPVQAVGFEAIV